MSKIHFYLKFIYSKGNLKKFNWNIFLPVVGVIIGTTTVSLTLSVMEGMEYSLFSRLKNISYQGKIMRVEKENYVDLSSFLNERNIEYTKGVEEKLILLNNHEFRLVNILAVENFKEFKNNIINKYIEEEIKTDQIGRIYIGRTLSIRLDAKIGDTLAIAAPQSINLFTGLPKHNSIIIGAIFNFEILDYDQKYIFSELNTVEYLIPENLNNIYLQRTLEKGELDLFKTYFPDLIYKTWEDKHQTFISAMRLEKFTYSLFGFFIIGISGFTLLSMMSLSVMQKIPQIGILKSMGFKRKKIGSIFLIQALLTGLISSSIGILLCKIIIKADDKYQIVHQSFPEAAFFDFPLILQDIYIPLIILSSTILLILSGIYPALKASRMDVVQAVEYQR